jgi:hypothetical protein
MRKYTYILSADIGNYAVVPGQKYRNEYKKTTTTINEATTIKEATNENTLIVRTISVFYSIINFSKIQHTSSKKSTVKFFNWDVSTVKQTSTRISV